MKTWNFEDELITDAMQRAFFVEHQFRNQIIDVQGQAAMIVDE